MLNDSPAYSAQVASESQTALASLLQAVATATPIATRKITGRRLRMALLPVGVGGRVNAFNRADTAAGKERST